MFLYAPLHIHPFPIPHHHTYIPPPKYQQDLLKDAAPLYKKAKKLYDGIAAQLVTQGHSLDVFAVALEQVGLAEMKEAVERTGGLTVQTDTYTNPVFYESLPRVFLNDPGAPGYLGLVSTATFEVCAVIDRWGLGCMRGLWLGLSCCFFGCAAAFCGVCVCVLFLWSSTCRIAHHVIVTPPPPLSRSFHPVTSSCVGSWAPLPPWKKRVSL